MIIQCPECHKDVSDNAKACPHCGYQLNKDSNIFDTVKSTNLSNPFSLFDFSKTSEALKNKRMKTFLILDIILVLLLLLIYRNRLTTIIIGVALIFRTILQGLLDYQHPNSQRKIYCLFPYDDLLFPIIGIVLVILSHSIILRDICMGLSVLCAVISSYKCILYMQRITANPDVAPEPIKTNLFNKLGLAACLLAAIITIGSIISTNNRNKATESQSTSAPSSYSSGSSSRSKMRTFQCIYCGTVVHMKRMPSMGQQCPARESGFGHFWSEDR